MTNRSQAVRAVLLAAVTVLLGAVLSLAAAMPAHAAAGSWRQDNTGWWYAYDDGGYARNGWEQVGEKWYHFDRFGYMDTGWELVGGEWYWLGSDGAMRTGWYTVDGEWQWSDSSGVWHPNTWVQSGGRWWYQWADGTYPTNGWQLIDGKWYHFDGAGYMQTGWLSKSGTWYYLEGSGAMASGWKQVGDTWYYLEPSGAMATGWKQLGDTWYFLRADGSMVANAWVGGTYWMGSSGAMATSEWVDSGRYYVDPAGEWVEGHQPITAPVTPASDFDYVVGDYILNDEVRTGAVPSGYTKMFGCMLSDNAALTYTEGVCDKGMVNERGFDCGHGVYITGYHGSRDDTVVLPDEIDGLPVVYASVPLWGGLLDASRCASLKLLNTDVVVQLELGGNPALCGVEAYGFERSGGDSARADYVDFASAPNLSLLFVNSELPSKIDLNAGSLELFGCPYPDIASLIVGDAPKLRELYVGYVGSSGLSSESIRLGACPELRFLTVGTVDLSGFTKADYPNLIEVNGQAV